MELFQIGVSLTVQWIDEGRTQFKVHVTPETARRSNLGGLFPIPAFLFLHPSLTPCTIRSQAHWP